MYKKVVNLLYLLILILTTFNNIVKSDITNESELNTLWWIAIQYGFAWNLSSGKVCSNIGIVCDPTLKTVKSLTLNSTIPLGSVIAPGSISTTTTANSLGSASTTSGYTIGTSGSSTTTTTTTTTSGYTIGTSGSSTTTSGYTIGTSGSSTRTSGYTISTSGSSTTTYDPTTTSGYTIGTSGSSTTSGYTIGTSGSSTTSGYTIGTTGSSTTTSYDPTTSTTSGYTTDYTTTTSYDPTTTTTTYDPTTTTSGYTISSSGSSTSLSPSPSVLSQIPIETEILPVINLVDFSSNLQSRKLQTIISNQPIINYLDFQNLTSLVISGITTNNVNILDYINQMTGLEYIEITNIQNLNIFPDLFLFYCPKVTTLIVRNVPATKLSDVFFTKTDGPLTNIILDFPIVKFDWSETNSINSLFLRLNNNSYINIDGYTWQQLKQLTIYTEAPISIINMSNLTSVSIYCTNPNTNVPFEFTNSIMGSLNFKNCHAVDGGLSFTGTNLTSLVFLDGGLSYSVPIVGIPPNLEIFDIENSTLSQLPSNLNLNLKQLIIPLNSVSGQLPSFTQLQKINTSNNHLSGPITESFCSTPDIYLANNQFTSIPDCFKCHWNSLASHWLAGNQYDLTPNSSFICDFKLYVSSFDVLSVGETLDITGENLGWQTPSTTPGLQMIIPNSKFTFSFPPKPILLSAVNKILQFTPDQSASIEWNYYNLEIFKVDFIQFPNRLIANITGTFDKNGVVYINNSSFNSPLIHLHQYITVELPTTFKEGPTEIFIKSTKVSSPIVKQTFKRIFPKISSASIVTLSNNQLTIYGDFCNSTGSTIQSVSVNNQSCVIISSNATVIIVNAPTYSQGGFASISINDNGFGFTSSKIVYYEYPKSNQCSSSCENGGTCMEGQCSCVGDYYGPTCSYKKPQANTYSLVTDQTQPQATYSLSTVEFQFSLSSIQELDFNDKVVQEIKIDNWEYKEDKTNELGVASIYYSNQSNVIVSASVVVPTKSVNYEFAGITMNLEKDQVKVSLNISGWVYQSSLNTLRAVFISTSKSNTPEVDNKCQSSSSSNNSTINSQTDSSNSLLSFTLTRNGGILFGSFIDRMISNGRIAISKVVDMGTIDSISYVGINMPQCNQCLLDPNYAVLVDPQFSDGGDGDSCSTKSNSRAWVIPVAVVIPIVSVVALSVVGYVFLKKHFYVYRDGKTFKLSKRRKSKSKFSMDHLG
ncbi:hypothetical protein ACTA71_005226 [Dictyostelium dimigraforme]